ncbi:glycosyltransferase family 2 protein [Candidatus Bathyarchaeota archaeon]|nr:glycosyltransferase family 2 protein [Candidatus Bathyarchaeota archaeon]
MVPVKDEEKVIGRLLEALLKLRYPPEKKEILIVEDGSTDRTVEVCSEYVKRYPGQVKLIRKPLSEGKPSALNYALKYVKGDIIGFFDADSVPHPDSLMNIYKYFEDDEVAAVQGRTSSINADENMLTKLISYEETVWCETYLRGKDVLDLFVHLRGSCQFVRRDALQRLGGFDENSLSEDMELSARLIDRGYKIRYAPDVCAWQETPADLKALFRQRTRWFRGSMEVALRYGKLLRKGDRRSVDAELTLVGPYMFLPCMLGYFLGLLSLIFPVSPNPVLTFMGQGLALSSTITLFLVGTALLYLTKPKKAASLLWPLFVYAYWMIQNFVAFYAFAQMVLRWPRKWVKTTKRGVITETSISTFPSILKENEGLERLWKLLGCWKGEVSRVLQVF